jgi:hypothetical protein
VTVTGVNDPPIAVKDTIETEEDTPVEIDVLVNDSDPDGMLIPSTVTVVDSPAHGQVNGPNPTNGVLTYAPLPQYYGNDMFAYTVEDDSGGVSNIDTVFITVTSVNDPPQISQFPELKFHEDDSLVYPKSEIYNYISDPDSADTVFTFICESGKYVVAHFDSLNLILKAPVNWAGQDSFALKVSDGQLSDSTKIAVSVLPVNDPPTVNLPDSIGFKNTQNYVLQLSDYVEDIDSPLDSLEWQFSVTNDSLEYQYDPANFELTLTAPNFVGLVFLRVTITDDSLAQAIDSLEVHVRVDPSGIEDPVNLIPKEYSLEQNYPNPFNPSTYIKFGLPKSGKVNIEIFNILGQKVTTLIDDFRPAGYHVIRFNANYLASGIYFYKIQAGDFVKIKKMILMK